MKKLLMLLVMVLTACSAQSFPGEDLGETQQATSTNCSITGAVGSDAWPPESYITGVHVTAGVSGKKLTVTRCTTDTNSCADLLISFADVHWSDVNGDFVADVNYPLRRVKTEAPGCQLTAPTKYCMTFEGDNYVGDHVNLLQNGARLLSDRPITLGVIEAPVGYGVSRFVGLGTIPQNTLQMVYVNSTHTGMATKDWHFDTPNCN